MSFSEPSHIPSDKHLRHKDLFRTVGSCLNAPAGPIWELYEAERAMTDLAILDEIKREHPDALGSERDALDERLMLGLIATCLDEIGFTKAWRPLTAEEERNLALLPGKPLPALQDYLDDAGVRRVKPPWHMTLAEYQSSIKLMEEKIAREEELLDLLDGPDAGH
jgi:hypothetical protein